MGRSFFTVVLSCVSVLGSTSNLLYLLIYSVKMTACHPQASPVLHTRTHTTYPSLPTLLILWQQQQFQQQQAHYH